MFITLCNPAAMKKIGYTTAVVRYGELALKSQRVRKRFEKTLIKNMEFALKKKQLIFDILQEWGRVYVYGSQIDEIVETLTKMFGVVSVSPAVEVQPNLEAIGEKVVSVIKHRCSSKKNSFALRVTRVGAHEFTSQEIAVSVGDMVRKNLGFQVDLEKPDIEVFIEVRGEKTFIYTEKVKGPGGLPVGTQGKIFSIIRNKQDVHAVWYLLKRGCDVVALGEKDVVKPLIENWFLWKHIILLNENITNDTFITRVNNLVEKYNCSAVVVGESFDDLKAQLIRGKSIDVHLQVPVLRPILVFGREEINERIKELVL